MRQNLCLYGVLLCTAWLIGACNPPSSPPPSSPAVFDRPTATADVTADGTVAVTGDDALIVSAAADLIPAFEEIGAAFTHATGIPVVFNFGSSGMLAQQIEQGAPVDVYASANRQYIEELVDGGHVLAESVVGYGHGRLTLWLRADSPLELTEIADLANPAVGRIAIANPEHAPYGMAAREALTRAGLWATLQPRLILGENIAATLQYVESGNVDVGIVALSLSLAAGDEGRWTLIPADLHDPIEQTIAVVARAPQPAAAQVFIDYVNSEAGRAIMRGFGFVQPGEEFPDRESFRRQTPGLQLTGADTSTAHTPDPEVCAVRNPVL